MKSASAGLVTHITSESPTLATLWRVVRRDGVVFRFTDHNQNITYGGETYLAAIGYQRSAVSSGADLAVDETELVGLIDAGSILESDLRAGLWDGAAVRIFLVNWADLTQGELKLRRGTLGEVIVDDRGAFRAELRGLAQPLQQPVGAIYQAECRADLGDSRCLIDLTFGAGWTQQAAITSVTDSVTYGMAAGLAGFADGWFDGGVVIWQSGANAGVAREVIAWTQAGRVLSLLAPPPFAPAVSDVLNLQPGCDKRWATCRDKFSNRFNFRGEPLVPGANAIIGGPA
jgi:uncharacterized phage protein (TIGR02218 family)